MNALGSRPFVSAAAAPTLERFLLLPDVTQTPEFPHF